jgi:hypothetical protein
MHHHQLIPSPITELHINLNVAKDENAENQLFL